MLYICTPKNLATLQWGDFNFGGAILESQVFLRVAN
jgi:hypothetical protein